MQLLWRVNFLVQSRSEQIFQLLQNHEQNLAVHEVCVEAHMNVNILPHPAPRRPTPAHPAPSVAETHKTTRPSTHQVFFGGFGILVFNVPRQTVLRVENTLAGGGLNLGPRHTL